MPVRMIVLVGGEEKEIALTPMRSIRYKCLDCTGGSFQDVRECEFNDCAFYGYRLGHKSSYAKLTPVKSIRRFCVDFCSDNQPLEVRRCTCPDCTLYPYRMGKRPND